MSVFVKIRSMMADFTRKEAKIANYALSYPQALKTLSSDRLADTVGVSQSSIVKFSQKLGYKGYSDFRFAVFEASQNSYSDVHLHGEITLADNFESLNKKLLQSKTKVLSETADLNHEKDIMTAAKLVKKGQRILISGIGASALVARDLAYKLQKLGFSACAEESGHIQLAYVASFAKNDLVIAISESGETRDVVATATLAKEKDASVISITGYSANAVSKVSDVKLYTVAENTSIRISSIISRTSQEYVIDLLFLAITQGSSEFLDKVEESNRAVKAFKAG